ncbi:hypothetical protein V8G54_009673 [Vigna mungo]|uniref:Reverse transcriptase/retrotransposon-derived protein RNase H-like domain-containing protein n=1 Tax=Vigna mungo TaxID=3915 RepID=A0AAQ3NUF5_VIGMU
MEFSRTSCPASCCSISFLISVVQSSSTRENMPKHSTDGFSSTYRMMVDILAQIYYHFLQIQVHLRPIVSASGVATDPSKIQAMVGWPTTSSVKYLHGFLGVDKKAMNEAHVLAFPDFTLPFQLETDAFGFVMAQRYHLCGEEMSSIPTRPSFYYYYDHHSLKELMSQVIQSFEKQLFPTPHDSWEDLSLDFITILPPSMGHTVILVVVDHFSKGAHFGTTTFLAGLSPTVTPSLSVGSSSVEFVDSWITNQQALMAMLCKKLEKTQLAMTTTVDRYQRDVVY